MKYYYREHLDDYQRVKEEGKTSRGEIYGVPGFENFASRAFLEKVVPTLRFNSPQPDVLEYGCGTGPGACFLAARGFRVDASDLIPAAIEIAREQAAKRNLSIGFEVRDICELPHEGKKYDMIVDSYCLQGIVTRDDRRKLFAAVRARLKPEGYYLVSTATIDETQLEPDAVIRDTDRGTVYTSYQRTNLIDMDSHIVYRPLEEDISLYEDAVHIDGSWYLPVRRHYTPELVKAEIESAGFDVTPFPVEIAEQDGEHMVCTTRN